MKSLFQIALFGLGLLIAPHLCAGNDILLADFESMDYGQWQATGTAFGPGPARGTLPGQMEVTGFQGAGLVNSFFQGDDSIGTLTSPSFKLERKFMTFLIGGGGYANETCLNLVVDSKVVRSATGPNLQPGGSEQLAPAAWDVADLAGREAQLVIVDTRKGGWGHINVDHIALTDERGAVALAAKPAPPPAELTRRVRIDADFLQLPLKQRANGREKGVENFTIEDGGKVARFVHLQIAAPDQKPDFVYSYDVREFRGREMTFRFKSHDAGVLDRLQLSNQEIIDPHAYDGPHRPQFHFSPRLGWMNDVNGTYYHNGLYHLFYQANPTTAGTATGFDMHWGHSVSKDLVHWEEWPVALFPDETGSCYSGTAVIMRDRVPGLNDGIKLPAPALCWAGTSPFSQHLATSADGGRSWKRYSGNPVLPKQVGDGDRDPKLVWHEESQHYVMVLYVGGPDTYRIFRSKDLVHWEQTSVLPHWYECPEFIRVKSPTTGENLWLLYGCYRNDDPAKGEVFTGNSCYQLGRFDGRTFTPVSKIRSAHRGPNFYGALTFINTPNDRQVMMGWARGSRFPGEPFNQCASLPLELQLKAINGEDTLCYEPVAELNALRGEPLLHLSHVSVAEARDKLAALTKDELLDVTLHFRATTSAPVRITIRQWEFKFDPATGRLVVGKPGQAASGDALHCEGAINVRFLMDHGMVESFWNGGEAAYAISSLSTDAGPAFALEGPAMIEELVVYPLKSIWE